MSDNNDLLTIKEAAEYLKFDPKTIWRWLKAGKLPGSKVGGRWRLRRCELDEVVKKGEGK